MWYRRISSSCCFCCCCCLRSAKASLELDWSGISEVDENGLTQDGADDVDRCRWMPVILWYFFWSSASTLSIIASLSLMILLMRSSIICGVCKLNWNWVSRALIEQMSSAYQLPCICAEKRWSWRCRRSAWCRSSWNRWRHQRHRFRQVELFVIVKFGFVWLGRGWWVVTGRVRGICGRRVWWGRRRVLAEMPINLTLHYNSWRRQTIHLKHEKAC